MEESMLMLGDSLGVEFDEIEELQEPVLASDYRETPYVEIEEGTVAGLKQQAYGIIDDVAFVSMEVYVGIIKPEDKGAPDKLADNLRISGEPNLDVTFDPIIDSLPGTAARTINTVPVVINADPGYKHLGELPPSTAMVGGIDEFVE
jgi:4-hydroxy-tetrahydrodipicolinate reductase